MRGIGKYTKYVIVPGARLLGDVAGGRQVGSRQLRAVLALLAHPVGHLIRQPGEHPCCFFFCFVLWIDYELHALAVCLSALLQRRRLPLFTSSRGARDSTYRAVRARSRSSCLIYMLLYNSLSRSRSLSTHGRTMCLSLSILLSSRRADYMLFSRSTAYDGK